MKWGVIFLIIILNLFLVSASNELKIGVQPGAVPGVEFDVVDIQPPTPGTIDSADKWNTDEGVLDNVIGILTSWLTNDIGWITNAQETDSLSLHLNQDNWFNDSNGWINWDGNSNEYNFTKLGDNYYNKSEVDNIASAIAFDFFFTNHTSDLTGHYDLVETDVGHTESSVTSASLGAGSFNIFNFTTEIGVPEFNILRGGIYDVRLHLLKTGTRDVTITPKLYNMSSDGSIKNLLITFETSIELTNIDATYDLHGILTDEIVLADGDRLHMEFVATLSSGGPTTITLDMEGTTDTHLSIETSSNAFEKIFLRQDGTTPLTGNWNASKNISADTYFGEFNGIINWTDGAGATEDFNTAGIAFADRLNLTASTTLPQISIGSLDKTIDNTGSYDSMLIQHAQAGLRVASSQASSSGQGAGLILYSIDGVALASGDRLGFNLFGGLISPTLLAHGAGVSAYADGTWTTSGGNSAPTRIQFEVAPFGSTSRFVGLKINSSRSIYATGLGLFDVSEYPVYWQSADGKLGIDLSSEKYKENIKNITKEDIDNVLKLEGITYNKKGSDKIEYGLSAEKVAEHFPDLVNYEFEQIMKCIDDGVGGEVCDIDRVELVLNKTTGEPIPRAVKYDKIAVLTLELAQKTEQENKMLKDCITKSINFLELQECIK